ncbi:hypothetical protein ES705_41150 [subsurface metagenome]
MKELNSDEKFDFYLSEAKEKSITGWNFPYNKERYVTAPLTWSYKSIVLPYIRKAKSLLDMDTGGGELLSELIPLPGHTRATERYEPNLAIATKRLSPLGVKVFQYEKDDNLPFKDEEFELIINRHGSYSPKEIYRILEPEGYFVTQQVGRRNAAQLRTLILGDEKHEWAEWYALSAVKELEEAGFLILENKEHYPLTRIFDIGALVYHLINIPWEVPGFSVKKHKAQLRHIHEIIEKQGYLDLYNHRFFIKAQKQT